MKLNYKTLTFAAILATIANLVIAMKAIFNL